MWKLQRLKWISFELNQWWYGSDSPLTRTCKYFWVLQIFYHCFISHYFKITALLTELLKGSIKNKKIKLFEFPLTVKEVFNELWKTFCLTSVLKHFNPVLFIQLETDAFSFVLINILSQLFKNINGDDISWYFMTFWLWKMINVETHYETHDGKLLIIVMSFKHWCHYLNDSQHFIEILTDYNNLWYFINKTRLNNY